MNRRKSPSMRTLSIILFAFCVLFNTRCDIFEASDGEVVALEGHILFWIGEAHTQPGYSGDPSLMLFMATEKDYPCCNYSIANMIVRTDASIIVALLGIHKPDICLTAIGPATSRTELSLVPGKYLLLFSRDDVVDEYSVTLTDSSISVVGDGSRFTTATKPLVWRYPPRTFAYLCGTTTETSWMCSEFLDSLMVTGLFEEYQFPDSGFIPYPESSAGHYFYMPTLYFRYAKEADFDEGGAILERCAKTTTNMYTGVGLSLINWRNKRYHSWLLEE